ncbi:energy transducer TonB [Lacimicrobium alkaliphilum]|uniref:Protein TonB n=1 Tax=Lacimicrobium alkaliphilum TaxID=1526571 RepID=A0A0U3A7C7_9ALTE|nr:energy transducer TonB [Lacimicrobium alkaliphilum]ALS96894.1 hypothetical protein AT746_00445 [Lacimicrobium alkaliphilum]
MSIYLKDKSVRLIIFLFLSCLLAACQSTSETVIEPPKEAPIVGAEAYPEPVIRIAPAYPQLALGSGKEGWVLLTYNVDATGAPVDIEVQDSSPKGMFEESATSALRKWRYLPPKKNGEYQPQQDLKTVIEYRLK